MAFVYTQMLFMGKIPVPLAFHVHQFFNEGEDTPKIIQKYIDVNFRKKSCKFRISFKNFYKKFMRESVYCKFTKEDLYYAIKHSYTMKEFYKIVSSMGYYYYYKAGK